MTHGDIENNYKAFSKKKKLKQLIKEHQGSLKIVVHI